MLNDIITFAHRRNNPWWEGFPLDRLGDKGIRKRSPLCRYQNLERFSRSDFKYQYGNIKENRLYVLAAPNGIGKTTTLCRVAKRFGEENVIPGEYLFYFPCDKPVFKIGTELPITDAVDWYLQNIYDSYQRTLGEFGNVPDEPFSDEAEEMYLFLDDVHLIDGWAEEVTALLNSHPELNIVVTTPSAEAIDPEPFVTAEFSYDSDILLPRKFHDWATSFDQSPLESSDSIKTLCREIRNGFVAFAAGDGEIIDATLTELIDRLSVDPDEIERMLGRYLRRGDHTRPGQSVDQNIQLTIFRDIPQIQSIGSPAELQVLAAIAAIDAGNARPLKEWSSMLDVDRRTLDRYLKLLEEFYLVTPSGHYEHDVRRSLRLYPRDPAHIQALGQGSEISSTSSRQRLLMSVLFDHCKRLTYHLNDRNTPVEYWVSGDDIVDFIIELDDEENVLPITLARNSNIEQSAEAVQQFCDTEDDERPGGGLVISPISQDLPEVNPDSGILVLPAWLFLFIV